MLKFLRRPDIALRKVSRRLRGQGPDARVFVPNQIAFKGNQQLIPRQVFQTAENAFVHPRHFRSIQDFRSKNRDLDFYCFSAAERDDYMLANWSNHRIFDVYRRAVFGQMKADIFRYCVVLDNGGYWVDFNKGFNCSISKLHPRDARGLIAFESHPSLLFPEKVATDHLDDPAFLVVQWAFGFVKGHQILSRAIDRIVEIEPYFRAKEFANPKAALLTMSATGLFTWAVRNYAEEFGLGDIKQAGTDFEGHGLFRLEGWQLSIDSKNHYSKLTNAPIVND